MYLAPLEAIWPPILLMGFAAFVGLVSAWFGIKSLVVLAIVGFAILIGDIFGRSKDYLNARRRFSEAYDEEEKHEVVRRFRRAWCARVACSAAWNLDKDATELNRTLGDDFVKVAYVKLGYRWYHIFPDHTFSKNSPFIKSSFWIHLFTGKMKRDRQEQETVVMEPAE